MALKDWSIPANRTVDHPLVRDGSRLLDRDLSLVSLAAGRADIKMVKASSVVKDSYAKILCDTVYASKTLSFDK